MEVFNFQVPLGSARTQELPPLQMDPAVGTLDGGSSQAQPPAIIASAARGAFVLHPLGRCLATTTGAGRFGGRQGDFGRFEGKT